MENYKNCYLFVLGRETKIALVELESVLRRFCFDVYTFNVAGNLVFIKFSTDYKLSATDLINSLGGTIKIFKIISEIKKSDLSEKIIKKIELDKKEQGGKIKFGISNFTSQLSRKEAQDLGIKIKNSLKNSFSIRYIENKDGGDLRSIVSAKNKLDSKGIEFGVFDSSSTDCLLLSKLVVVNDPVSWSERDYGKPRSDKYAGMMPPKLARMLINITLGDASTNGQFPIINQCSSDSINENCPSRQSEAGADELKIENCNDMVVVDPFCGSGNILIEAIVLGLDVIGSDISEKAVNDSMTNLDWLKDQDTNNLKPNSYSLFKADATKDELWDKIKNLGIKGQQNIVENEEKQSSKSRTQESRKLIIVSEPSLGKPRRKKPEKQEIEKEIGELKKLYLEFLKNISATCHPSFDICNLCLIFPLFELENGEKLSLYNQYIDEIAELGYTPIRNLIYGREYQVVKREIVFFSLKK